MILYLPTVLKGFRFIILFSVNDVFGTEQYKKCFKSCPNECVRKSFEIKKSTLKVGTPGEYEFYKNHFEKFKNKTTQEVEYYIK